MSDRAIHSGSWLTSRLTVWVIVGVAAFGVALVVDRWVHSVAALDAAVLSGVERRDWYRMLRVVGFWPTWVVLGLGVTAAAGPGFRSRWRAGGMAAAVSSGLSGAAAEVLKVMIARERPGVHGEHVFRPLFSSLLNGSGLGLPSSHAAVAFGGAFVVWALDRRAGAVALAAACGCALTRVLSGAHFLSDVVASAVVAYAVALGVRAALKVPAWGGRGWV